MKSVIRGAMLTVAGVFAIAAAAHAETLEVTVPFAFMVGSQQMPAGVYRIERGTTMPSSVVLIRGQHGNTAQLFVQTTPLTGANPAGDVPALVFVPDEAAHRLTQVWGASAVGQELPTGRDRSRLIGRIVVRGQQRS
jgi:hypothetical protein